MCTSNLVYLFLVLKPHGSPKGLNGPTLGFKMTDLTSKGVRFTNIRTRLSLFLAGTFTIENSARREKQ
jgi:hypothetical protein